MNQENSYSSETKIQYSVNVRIAMPFHAHGEILMHAQFIQQPSVYLLLDFPVMQL